MLGIIKLDSLIALIFGIYVKFLDFLFLVEFMTILLALLSTSTILLSLAINTFNLKFGNLIVFNKDISSAAILLKPWIKY